MNEFKERLQDLMGEHNLNRVQLANIIDMSSVSVDDYFNKDYYPQIEVAKRMAKYFNCSLDYLFGLSDERNKIAYNDKPFFENLENLLKENKIPITRAMKEMGMSSYNYYRWRNGTYPTTLKLLEIVKYFEVSLDYLVGYSNKDE